MFVNRNVVGDEDPLGLLVVVGVEDLGVQGGGVVDDDQNLGLRVEIGPRTDGELVELEAAWVGHARQATR